MQRFGGIADESLSRLAEASDEMTSGFGEFVIWRHQDLTDRKAGSKTASGINPTGTDFETTDYAVEAVRDPNEEETIFRANVMPTKGDLIITLRGNPQTRWEALEAEAADFYCVIDAEDYRQDERLSLCRIRTELDQNRDYAM